MLSLDISCPFVLEASSLEQEIIEHSSTTSIQDLSIGNSTLIVEMADEGPCFDVLTNDFVQKVIGDSMDVDPNKCAF